jgi:hypothetical protein
MLTVSHRFDRVSAMHVVRRRNADGFNLGIGAEVRDRRYRWTNASRACSLLAIAATSSISGNEPMVASMLAAPCPKPMIPIFNGRDVISVGLST